MNPPVERSTFVTVVAWILIVVSAFTTLITLLQNLMVHFVFRSAGIDMTAHPPPSDAPAFARFLFEHMELVFLAFLLVSALTLVASIGLLKRMNWARLVVVALMALGVAWCLGGLVVQVVMMLSVRDQFMQPGGPGMSAFFYIFIAVNMLISLAFAGLFGWIAKRLLSPPIIAEFRPA